MDTILNRISEIAMNEGIKISVLERTIKASKGVLSRAINNGTDIQMKWIQAIVDNYPNYSAEWLLTGRGSMIKEPACGMASDSHNTSGIKADAVNIGKDNGNVIHNHKTQCDQLQNLINEMDKRMYAQTEDFQHQAAAFQEQIKSFQEQIKEKDEYIRDVIKKKHESNQNHERQMADLRHQNAQLLEHNGKLIDENSRLTHKIITLLEGTK